jgi:hypothetical protein
MKAFVAACAAFSLAMCGPVAAAEHSPERLCPAAIEPLDKFAEVTKGPQVNPEAVVEAAQRLESVYHTCASTAIDNGRVEPEGHYDQVREAQFAYSASRSLLVLHRFDEAKTEADTAHKVAQAVFEWSPATDHDALGANGRSDLTSNYKGTAQEILAQTDKVLDVLKKIAAAAASPAPSPAP